MFTKAYSFLIVGSVFFLSILLYVAYFWFADSILYFDVYKIGRQLVSSPQLFLIVLLLMGVTILADSLYINVIREFKTPLSLLFNSLNVNRKYTREERDVIFRKIIKTLEENNF